MVQQANENVLTKIEMKKQNLEFMRQKQEAVKLKAQKKQSHALPVIGRPFKN